MNYKDGRVLLLYLKDYIMLVLLTVLLCAGHAISALCVSLLKCTTPLGISYYYCLEEEPEEQSSCVTYLVT